MGITVTLPALNVPTLLRQFQLHPKKSLGQNFLVEEIYLQRVVEIAELDSSDVVLEIGAGIGSLTRYLAGVTHKVVAVEIDKALFPILRQVVGPYDNIELEAGDILELDPGRLVGVEPYKVVANIPYYITSAVIRHLLSGNCKPLGMILTVQKEVAERICAAPGEMSLLALSVQLYGHPRIAAHIPAGAFYPVPNVDSCVVRIDLYPWPVIPQERIETFFKLARAGFGQKRKQLRNSLGSFLLGGSAAANTLLRSVGIDPQRRAETLTLEEWRNLAEKIDF